MKNFLSKHIGYNLSDLSLLVSIYLIIPSISHLFSLIILFIIKNKYIKNVPKRINTKLNTSFSTKIATVNSQNTHKYKFKLYGKTFRNTAVNENVRLRFGLTNSINVHLRLEIPPPSKS